MLVAGVMTFDTSHQGKYRIDGDVRTFGTLIASRVYQYLPAVHQWMPRDRLTRWPAIVGELSTRAIPGRGSRG